MNAQSAGQYKIRLPICNPSGTNLSQQRASAFTPMIEIHGLPDGRTFELVAEQFLPAPRAQVFTFFADAVQLERITPPWLRFTVATPMPITMGEGTIIDYKLRIHGVPLRWRSRISGWDPPSRFVDEQLRGPYRSWRHEHTLAEAPGGTVVRDRAEYRVPGGRLAHRWFVKPDLLRIFAYRQQALADYFRASVSYAPRSTM